MNDHPQTRLVVLISGHGSNLQAILDACSQGTLNARVQAVFSNKTEAYGLERARQAGVPAVAVPKPRDLDRRIYDAQLGERVAAYQPEWVVLAGWVQVDHLSYHALPERWSTCTPLSQVCLQAQMPLNGRTKHSRAAASSTRG